MQLANIINSSTFSMSPFLSISKLYKALCILPIKKCKHVVTSSSYLFPSTSFLTNLENGREKPYPYTFSFHLFSTNELSQGSTSLEMALFLFKFTLNSFPNTLSCHLLLVLLFNGDSHNCICYWNFILSGLPHTTRNMLS